MASWSPKRPSPNYRWRSATSCSEMSINPSLLLLADGRFPAGGHANSAGTESAIRCGDVHDLASLERFLASRLATTGVVDAAFAASACGGTWALDVLDHEYDIRTAAPRLRVVSRQLGRQLLRSARLAWPHPALDSAAGVAGGCHQAVVLGVTVRAGGGAPLDAAMLAAHHLASAVTTAAVRMLGFDPIAVAAIHARAVASFQPDPAWVTCAPAELPATTSTITEIHAEHHGQWDARLFVA
jgi:urease accessory protein